MKRQVLKKRVRILLVILLAGIALLTAAAAVLRIYDLRQQAQPDTPQASVEEQELAENPFWVNNVEIPEAGGVALNHVHIPWENSRRPGEIREIHYLTIHETDNRGSSADAAAHSSLLTTDTSDVTGWHYTVDDHSIYHNIPDNEIGWNAGDNRTELGGNMNGIGIEMCVNLSNDFEQTLRNTAALAAELLVAYDLNVDDVRLHSDFMDKVCPHRLMTEGRVAEFYEMIRQAYVQRAREALETEMWSVIESGSHVE